MSFPTTPELDNFNRANGTPGANWTVDSLGNGGAAWSINGNQIENGISAYGEMYWNPDDFADPEGYFDLTQLANGGLSSFGIRMLMSPGSAAADGYAFTVVADGSITINEVVNGDDSAILASDATIWQTGQYGMSVIDGVIKGYQDGLEVISVADATFGGPFFISIWGYNGGGSSIPYAIDNFGGGEAVFDPPTATPVQPSYSRFPKAKLRR